MAFSQQVHGLIIDKGFFFMLQNYIWNTIINAVVIDQNRAPFTVCTFCRETTQSAICPQFLASEKKSNITFHNLSQLNLRSTNETPFFIPRKI